MTPPVFLFTSARAYLLATYESKKLAHPRFSLRAWSRRLGYQSPSLLMGVLQGNRNIPASLGAKLKETCVGPSLPEATYFDTLLLLDKTRNADERQLLLNTLSDLRPTADEKKVSADQFAVVSDWIHFTLIETLSLKNGNGTPEFLADALGCDPATVAAALTRLWRLGLITRAKDGTYTKTKQTLVVRPSNPSTAIKRHHTQMLRKAQKAIYEQPLEERDFRSTKLAIRASDLARAYQVIQKCHRDLQKLAANTCADTVYTLNSQFFRLTRSR